MDFNRLNKIYKINSSDLSEKHTKERLDLISDFARRNILNSGPAFKAFSEKLKDEIKDLSDVYINSLSDCIDPDIEISKDEQNQIISKYRIFIQQQTNHKISILKSKLAASNFTGVVSASVLSGFNQIVNRALQIGIDKISLMIEDVNSSLKKNKSTKVENKIKVQNEIIGKNKGWKAIEEDFGINKQNFGKKINFVKDQFKRKVLFRDIEHAYILALYDFSKPAVILAGSVIEELLRLYLIHKGFSTKNSTLNEYIKCCEDNDLLKSAILRLSDSVRHFRNLVHIRGEENKKYTISKATAKGAVSSIFTIANDFS